MTYKRRKKWSWRSGGAAGTVAIVLPVSLRSRAADLPVVAALVLAGSANGQCVPSILGSVDTPSAARGVAVSGTVAYVADGPSGLQVIDVSDPGSPVLLGSVGTPNYAFGVAVSADVAYVADGFSGLQVIDVSSCEPCPADLDGSGAVDFDDLLIVLSEWGDYQDCPPFIPADIDQDCDVDFDDLLIVLAAWGPCDE